MRPGQECERWDAPLLITGCVRSGTTALTRLLSTHPAICVFNEYHLFVGNDPNRGIWDRLFKMPDSNAPPDLIGRDLASLRTRVRAELPDPASNTALRNWLFDACARPPRIYGDKLPMRYLLQMKHVGKLFPKARCVVTIRDGRDVVAAQLRNHRRAARAGRVPDNWMKPSVREAESLWLRSASYWLQLREKPPLPCLELRYEDTTRAPEIMARKICEFTDMPFDERDFQALISGFAPTRVGSWRDELGTDENVFSDEFNETLRAFGYA